MTAAAMKTRIIEMLDYIPDTSLQSLFEKVQDMIPDDIDDIATADDIEAYEIGMQEYRNGETKTFEEMFPNG